MPVDTVKDKVERIEDTLDQLSSELIDVLAALRVSTDIKADDTYGDVENAAVRVKQAMAFLMRARGGPFNEYEARFLKDMKHHLGARK